MEPIKLPALDGQNYLVYDGECPLCSRYVQMVRLRERLDGLQTISARHPHPVVEVLTQHDLDLNEGIVLIENGLAYYADAAVRRIAMLSGGGSWMNRLNSRVFQSGARARVLYPALKTGRNVLLKLLGRKPIPKSVSRTYD
ncbi:MAG: DCC1-like thiol-disulfide oxidoreductase family protein [Pseudomonadota bacterium]